MQSITQFIIIWFAWTAAAAHVLSWLGCFNRIGMLATLIPLACVLSIHAARKWDSRAAKLRFVRSRRRLSRGFPLAFFILSILLLVGAFVGVVPKQCDYLEYRLARMMLWIANGGIAWLPGWESRLNYNGTAQECAVLPSILIFRTDFLAQVLSYLMFITLPGQTFKVLRGFNVSIKLSRMLMWALPLSVAVVITQTGGSGNDFPSLWFGIVLLAQCLELEAAAKRRLLFEKTDGEKKAFLWNPLLFAATAAVFSNIKSSNVFLLFAFGLFILRLLALKKISLRLAPTMIAVVVFALCSVIPLLARNYQTTGSLTGDAKKETISRNEVGAMFVNSLITVADSAFQPPVFPGGEKLGEKLSELPLIKRFKVPDRRGLITFQFMQTEEMAGTGISYGAFFVFFVAACFCGLFRAREKTRHKHSSGKALFFFAAVSVFALMAILQMSSSNFFANCSDRFMAVYWYIILLALAALASVNLKERALLGVRLACLFAFICAFTIAIVIPNRMLIPDSAFAKASGIVSKSLEERAKQTSFAYRNHGREFMGLTPSDFSGRLAYMNPGVTDLSVYGAYWRTGDSILLADWRKIENVWLSDAAILEERQIILTSRDLPVLGFDNINELCDAHAFSVVSQKEAIFHSANGLQTIWHLVK